jgi:hypothetical protein
MKVLFTGMSSSHCKEGKNESFFKTLAKAYGEFSEVVWSEPKLSWTRADLETYDAIVFGFTPPTSMGANYIYGAIHVLNLMYESPKLALVVDSPQMWQYKNSVRAFKRDPDQIFGSFYAKRRNYTEAKNGSSKADAQRLADKMSSIQWPKTYVPQLPWTSFASMVDKVPFISSESLVPLNLDSLLLKRDTPKVHRLDQWGVDNDKSSWWSTLSAGLRFSGASIKDSTRPKDLEAEQRISMSMGLVVAPQDRKTGTWWSYRYIQGMNTVTPIATNWQETAGFSEQWSLLAYQIEDMEPYERQDVAFKQRKAYEAAIPTKEQVINTLKNMMVDSQKEITNARN